MGSAETYNLIRRRERRNCEKRDASWCLRLASIPVLIKSVAFAILKKRRSASCPRTAPTLRLCTALHGPMRDQACPGDAGHATHDAELSGKKQWTGDNYRGSVMAWKARLPTGHPPQTQPRTQCDAGPSRGSSLSSRLEKEATTRRRRRQRWTLGCARSAQKGPVSVLLQPLLKDE